MPATDPSVTYMPSSRTKSVGRVGSFVRKCYLAGERSVIPCRQCENNATSRHSSSKLTSVETAARARARRAGMKERILQEKVDGNGWSLECGGRSAQKKHTAHELASQPAQSGSRVSMCINRGLVNHAYVFLVFGHQPPDARRDVASAPHASAPPPFQPTEASKQANSREHKPNKSNHASFYYLLCRCSGGPNFWFLFFGICSFARCVRIYFR